MLVKDSEDLGWFQAPANVGFVTLGLLYGEGDFKRSLILAVDCGDDTDCTGATLGALLGIMNGMAGIPEDWRAYIGDGIKSICLTNGHGPFPQDCTQLTECILNLLPIPILDGGHIVFFTLEMIMGRPVSATAREWSAKVGMALLLGLMILATWNDLTRLFS